MSQQIYLTKEKYEELKKELKERETIIRQKIAEDLKHAKEMGDLSENAAYSQAKNDKAFNDGKIMELEYILNHCEIIEKSEKNDKVEIGSTVKLQDENNKILEYKIVGPEESDPLKNLISYQSPLGQKLLNKKEGEEIKLEKPDKTFKKYKIISIN
ncbi:MAG TPA: transcription elongation factor GreA [Candidatus Paceibacterota bacterium]|jgi:transcription elongation factor GreA|nr:transcription elongation factor GreA [Candidatus Paceibacterota bacterium]